MGSVRKTPSGKFELTIRHRLLAKRVYLTFDDQVEAERYGDQVDKLLAQGVIPAGLVAEEKNAGERVVIILRAWINSGKPATSERAVLGLLVHEVGAMRLPDLTYKWAEAWVQQMKLDKNLAPGTIRKRIGALSRCLDDYLRAHPDVQVANPLKLLPRGATTYNVSDRAKALALEIEVKEDVMRDRRLRPGELPRILATLDGVKREDRERALTLPEAAALRMLFLVILYTGVRLREAYTIRAGQLQLRERILRVRASKQWHGREKWRDVPIRRELYVELAAYLQVREFKDADLLFPWWDGDPLTLPTITTRLSSQFGRIFEYSRCEDLREHDLRHEATCQWYELRDASGGWLFREAEIARIMGWAPGSKQPARYASFRAEDLAARLWA